MEWISNMWFCSIDNIDIYCIMELMVLPMVLLLLLVGLIAVVYMTVWVLYSIFYNGLFVTYLAGYLGRRVNLKKLGQWAVVTGATDGIGKAYAEELARLGIDIVLISRTYSKLEDVAKNIETQFKVKTKIIQADYTKRDIYDKIGEQLQGLEIGILINNVGMSYEFPEYFLDIHGGEDTINNMVNCNIISCLMMTRLVLPQMVERRKGAILNLSSTAAVYPMPFLNVYSATKVCVDYFSRALQTEYRSKGVIIQSVIPYFVATNMSKIKKTSTFVPNPTAYVRGQLKTIGLEDRTFGYLAHKLQGWGVEFMVHFFPSQITNSIFYGALKDMNNRARSIQAKNNKKH
ncbi:hypothetical protein CHUAL_006483 [Chamberlinius hualienensis]